MTPATTVKSLKLVTFAAVVVSAAYPPPSSWRSITNPSSLSELSAQVNAISVGDTSVAASVPGAARTGFMVIDATLLGGDDPDALVAITR